MQVTARGLGAALAVGDYPQAEMIHTWIEALAWPSQLQATQPLGRQILAGRLPLGDALLAWAYSQPEPPNPLAMPLNRKQQVANHRNFFIVGALILLAWIFLNWALARRLWRRRTTSV